MPLSIETLQSALAQGTRVLHDLRPLVRRELQVLGIEKSHKRTKDKTTEIAKKIVQRNSLRRFFSEVMFLVRDELGVSPLEHKTVVDLLVGQIVISEGLALQPGLLEKVSETLLESKNPDDSVRRILSYSSDDQFEMMMFILGLARLQLMALAANAAGFDVPMVWKLGQKLQHELLTEAVNRVQK